MSTAKPGENLYADLLGDAWGTLDPMVHKGHLGGDLMEASAVFRGRSGRNVLARLFTWLGRLPAEAEATKVKLSVRRVPEGEVWDRDFEGTRLASLQVNAGDGLMG